MVDTLPKYFRFLWRVRGFFVIVVVLGNASLIFLEKNDYVEMHDA